MDGWMGGWMDGKMDTHTHLARPCERQGANATELGNRTGITGNSAVLTLNGVPGEVRRAETPILAHKMMTAVQQRSWHVLVLAAWSYQGVLCQEVQLVEERQCTPSWTQPRVLITRGPFGCSYYIAPKPAWAWLCQGLASGCWA